MKYFLFSLILISNSEILFSKTGEDYFSIFENGINYNLKAGKKIAEGSAGIIYEAIDSKNKVNNRFVIKKFKNILLYKMATTSYKEEKLMLNKLKGFDLTPASFFFDSKNVIIKEKLNGKGLYDIILQKHKYFPEEYQELIDTAAELFLKIFKANITLKRGNDFFWDLHFDNVMYTKLINSTSSRFRWYIIDLNSGKPNPLLKIANIQILGKKGFMTNIFDYTCRNYFFKKYPKDRFPFFLNEFNLLVEKIALKILATQDEELINSSQVFFGDQLIKPNTINYLDQFKNCRKKE